MQHHTYPGIDPCRVLLEIGSKDLYRYPRAVYSGRQIAPAEMRNALSMGLRKVGRYVNLSPLEIDDPLVGFIQPMADLIVHWYVGMIGLVLDRIHVLQSSNGLLFVDQDIPWPYLDLVRVGPTGQRGRDWWSRRYYGLAPAGYALLPGVNDSRFRREAYERDDDQRHAGLARDAPPQMAFKCVCNMEHLSGTLFCYGCNRSYEYQTMPPWVWGDLPSMKELLSNAEEDDAPRGDSSDSEVPVMPQRAPTECVAASLQAPAFAAPKAKPAAWLAPPVVPQALPAEPVRFEAEAGVG